MDYLIALDITALLCWVVTGVIEFKSRGKRDIKSLEKENILDYGIILLLIIVDLIMRILGKGNSVIQCH